MSSPTQSIVEGLITNNYASLAMATVVLYDYILNIPNEIEYVWAKPWTWVSTAYVLVRYLGIYVAIWYHVYPWSRKGWIVPDFDKYMVTAQDRRTGIIVAASWSYLVFTTMANLVVVLRVYAMWNQSKIVLRFLLAYYIIEVIIALLWTAISDNPHTYFPVMVGHILNYSVCYPRYTTVAPYLKYLVINNFVFEAVLLILALIPTIKQSMSMYKASGRWQPNRYMALIVREGTAYIFLNVLNDTTNMIEQAATNPLTTTWLLVLGLLSLITLYPIIPRFIISIRELYAKDSRGHCEGIDTGFGISSRVDAVSAIAFADDGRGDQDRDEEMQIEAVEIEAR